EIKTRDRYGLANYAFTSSHPAIVKWNRALSLAFSLGLIIFTYLLAFTFFRSNSIALACGLLVAISPPLLPESGKIGVDGLMSLMCVVTVWSGLRLFDRYSTKWLWLTGLFAGLAVSSKYNAAPVAMLPLLIVLLKGKISKSSFAVSCLAPLLGFFGASPYILVEGRLFVEHIWYEVWHYGVAGHVGHEASRGLGQLLFYTEWLSSEAIGTVGLLIALLGAISFLFSPSKRAVVIFFFPLAYALLMICQKANLTRNMLVIIPFVALLIGYFIQSIIHRFSISKPILLSLILLPVALQPLTLSIILRDETVSGPTETRELASNWLLEHLETRGDTAISGQLMFPPAIYKEFGVSRVNDKLAHGEDLFLDGYARYVAGPDFKASDTDHRFLSLIKEFSGESRPQRIVSFPTIRIFELNLDPGQIWNLSSQIVFPPILKNDGTIVNVGMDCSGLPKAENYIDEGHCWVNRRLALIELPKSIGASAKEQTLNFEIMTPWSKQVVLIVGADSLSPIRLDSMTPGEFFEISIPVSEKLQIYCEQVHSPFSQGLNSDPRRLAVAVRNLRLKPQ
ncbi:MAG: glycosyltransferase family 39 protein, partial [Bdellovibrionales bacterium]|nr:glycosyltransferase family 39 protein [Bdellovibrionales bacterium]